MDFLNRYLTYKTLDEMVKGLNKSKSKNQNNSILSLIMYNFDYFSKKTKEMPERVNKEQNRWLNIVNEILKFNEQIKWGQGLKILTTS